MTPTEREIKRLRRVYAEYRRDEMVRSRWAPDNPGNRMILEERSGALYRALDEGGCLPLDQRHVLEIGCGDGQVLASLTGWGANPAHLVGVDILDDRIACARHRYPQIAFQYANAEALPFDDASFDLIVSFTVFTSILDGTMARNVAMELQRVLKPGGAVAWYDFRYDNPRNPHVRGLSRSSIRRLFPGFGLALRSVTVLPPLVRALGPWAPRLYPFLSALPILRTHYLGLIVKPR